MTEKSLAISSPERIRSLMRAPEVMTRFIEVLGRQNASAYVTSVILAVANNEDLQKCSSSSIITAAMRAATLRLSCDPATKQAHLVPFKDKATLVVGYKGYYDMAQRTGRYRILNDFKIYEGQEVVEDQLRGLIEIRGFRDNWNVIGYGFYFEMLNGLKKVFYMTVEEIHAHAAKYSKTYKFDSGLWKKDFDAMARKTVIRLCLSRYGYMDPNDQLTLSAIDESEGAEEIDVSQIQVNEEPKSKRSEAEILHDLGYDATSVTEGQYQEEATTEPMPEPPPPAEPPASPYGDLIEKAQSDPTTAFWSMQVKIGMEKADARKILAESNNDFAAAFAALLKQAPPQ